MVQAAKTGEVRDGQGRGLCRTWFPLNTFAVDIRVRGTEEVHLQGGIFEV